MRREQICSLLTVVMTGAFFIALLWGYGQYQQNQRAMKMLENEYQRAYYNYLADTREMALITAKAHYATGLQQAILLSQVQTLAQSAAGHMAGLPIQQPQYQPSVAYLNQVGDYAAMLAESLSRGNTLDTGEYQNLNEISRQLEAINMQMTDMEQQVAGGSIVFARAEGSWWQAARTALSGSSPVQGTGAAEEAKTADGYFSRANALLGEVEPLSYGGKYSSRLGEQIAWGLYGQRKFSPEEALAPAREFLALTGHTQPELTGQEEIKVRDTLPLYELRFSNEAGQSIYMTVSQEGGRIISYVCDRPLGEARLSADSAIENADKFLERAGYENMGLISRQRLGDALLLQYAHLEQDILYYPDSLYIKAAMDNGDIVAFNAQEFWLNNRSRVLPAITREDNTALAYISNKAGEEIFCHEIRGHGDSGEYITYIGVDSMLEEKILRGYTAEDGSFYTR